MGIGKGLSRGRCFFSFTLLKSAVFMGAGIGKPE
jgi:hypothetical protein